MLWLPVLSVEMLIDAVPLPFTVPVPMAVAPSLNVIVPLGAPAPGAFTPTVAEKVRIWPGRGFPVTAGFTIAVAALFTVNKSVPPEGLAAKFVSPRYPAVKECGPTDRFDTTAVATPEIKTADATAVPPSRN